MDGKRGAGLKDLVRGGLIPTPTSSEHKRANQGAWSERKNSQQGRRLVDAAAQMVPTPSARDWRSGKASAATMERNARPLNEFVVMGQLGLPPAPAPENGDTSPPPAMGAQQTFLWPTPTASDGSKARLTPSNNRQGGPTLGAAAIAHGRAYLPTPQASDAGAGPRTVRRGGERLSEVMTGQSVPRLPEKNPRPKHVKTRGQTPPLLSPEDLEISAGLIPTPSATDAKGSRRHGYIEGNAGTTLTDFALGTTDAPESRGERDLCLSPRFVEWLMGWPDDWTRVR